MSRIILLLCTIFAYAANARRPGESSFCKKSGLTSGNGTQIREGFCSSTVQGQIPAVENMVSTLIIEPKNAARIPANTPLNIKVRTENMELGFFSDPKTEYYALPQTLNDNGIIKGHQHVVVQEMGDGTKPLDPQTFAFFKGLDKQPDGNNDLEATIDAGLPAGEYRMCTITGANSHQPVIMPVAQRGSQDDCIRITVVGGNRAGAGGNRDQGNRAAGNNGNNGNNENNNAAADNADNNAEVDGNNNDGNAGGNAGGMKRNARRGVRRQGRRVMNRNSPTAVQTEEPCTLTRTVTVAGATSTPMVTPSANATASVADENNSKDGDEQKPDYAEDPADNQSDAKDMMSESPQPMATKSANDVTDTNVSMMKIPASSSTAKDVAPTEANAQKEENVSKKAY